MKDIKFKKMTSQNLQKLRREIKEISERGLIKDAIRAGKFSGVETFEQGIDLINFVLKVNKPAESS